MQLNNTTQSVIQYFIKLPNGMEVGPYESMEKAKLSASTFPLHEGVPQIIPKTIQGQQVLFE